STGRGGTSMRPSCARTCQLRPPSPGRVGVRWERGIGGEERRLLVFLALILAVAAPATAQEEPYAPSPDEIPAAYAPGPRDPIGTRFVNVPTPYPIRARTVEVIFLHRFRTPLNEGSSSDLWGLDNGADVGMGLGLGITRHLDVSLLRSSFQENFELATKYLFLEQAPRVPLSIAIRAGVNRLEREGVADPTRPFAQLLLARRFGSGFNLLLAPSWVGDTPRMRDVFNVPIGLTVPLPHESILELEVIPKSRDLDESETAWHAALGKRIGGHIFELVFSNSRAITVDQYLGGDSDTGFRSDDVRFGFNLIREFPF
ncbi:MAG TPA: DUF5777 family beta-barrel protein, partial [Thermoanaerobaculia bacterium]|nr:DUF5777 family beta-barrel protein [Thermoanaerobaculia bacterium]